MKSHESVLKTEDFTKVNNIIFITIDSIEHDKYLSIQYVRIRVVDLNSGIYSP